MGRAPCCEKVGLKKGRWTAEEDDTLTKYIQTHGEGSWRSLPKNAGLLRCGKSCRLRWINYLRDDLKRGNISAQEEDMIIKLHASLGNRWSLIASQLPGRTDNEIKNYWNSHLCRKIDTFRRPNSEPLPILLNLSANNGPSKKKGGGRTSRAAMKKNKDIKVSSGNIVSMENGNEGQNQGMPNSCQELVPREEGILGPYEDSETIARDVEKSNLMLYGPTRNDNQFHQESSISTNSSIVLDDGLESGLMSFLDDINYDEVITADLQICTEWDWQGFIHENLWSNFEQDDQDQQQLEEEKLLSCLWENSDQESTQKQDALVNWLLS